MALVKVREVCTLLHSYTKGFAIGKLPDAASGGGGSAGFRCYMHFDAVLPHTTFASCLMYLKLQRGSG